MIAGRNLSDGAYVALRSRSGLLCEVILTRLARSGAPPTRLRMAECLLDYRLFRQSARRSDCRSPEGLILPVYDVAVRVDA